MESVAVASQLILHPTVTQSLKLLSTTAGRDKTYRALQFFSRFFAWYLTIQGQKDSAKRWNALKANLGLGRKLMRLGKPVEHLQLALRASQTVGEAAEQITTIGRQLSYCGFLAYDTIVWANAVKFIPLSPETAKKVTKTADRLWFTAILFSITHGLLKAGRMANEIKRLHSPQIIEKDVGDATERRVKLRALEATRGAIRFQFIIDVLDIWIPATNLGFVHFNDGVLGIFGLITSLMALRQQWGLAGRK